MEIDTMDGFDRLKSKNWFKLHRDLVSYAIETLKDAEFKLLIALKGSANDFDGDNVGKVQITIDSIIEHFGWSRGKSSQTLSGLRQKGFVKRIKKGNYYISQNLVEVQNNEHLVVQQNGHEVHSGEFRVQTSEHSKLNRQSYKDNKSSNSSLSQELSHDEIERIWEEICKENQEKELELQKERGGYGS